MKKWKKRLLVVTAVLLVIYFALPIVDRVWFAFRVPSDFSDAQWHGDWNSDQFSLVSGRLVVNLPNPVPIDQEFDVDALVYYRILVAVSHWQDRSHENGWLSCVRSIGRWWQRRLTRNRAAALHFQIQGWRRPVGPDH